MNKTMFTSSQIIKILAQDLIEKYIITHPKTENRLVTETELRLALAECFLDYGCKPIQLNELE